MIDPPAPQYRRRRPDTYCLRGWLLRRRQPQSRPLPGLPHYQNPGGLCAVVGRCNAHRQCTPRRCKSRCCFCLRCKFLTFFVIVSRIINFKYMSLVNTISPFFFSCCIFRGRGSCRGAVLKEASHHAAQSNTTQMFKRKVYLTAHVLLLRGWPPSCRSGW